jgi:hypothetical protein
MLFPACAFAVHQLRYQLAYGSRAGTALTAQGHGYLDSLAPWVALLAALGLGRFLVRFARRLAVRGEIGPARSFAVLWAVATPALLLTYALQEWLEGFFAAGHPGGLGGIFGHGGLWAVPLALLAGVVIACVLRLAEAVVGAVSGPTLRHIPRVRSVGRTRPRSAPPLRCAPLAGRSAGRAPPAARCAAFA